MSRYDWISLTTDYGRSDGFAASCHGVLARLAPHVRVIEVTHDVPPGQVRIGSAILAQTAVDLPPSVHVAVVDPAVGTPRRPIAIETPRGVLVGPDNGLLPETAEALGGVLQVVELTRTNWFGPTVSATFHGRDIFTPVAARLATGSDIGDAGAAVDPATLSRLPDPVDRTGQGWIEAEVRMIDRFGNVQLVAHPPALAQLGPNPPGRQAVSVARVRADGTGAEGHPALRVDTFAAVPPGALAVFVDAAGRVAVAVNRGRAATALAVEPGDLVRITAAD